MSLADFKKIIDEIGNWEGDHIKNLRLYNAGEPMLNPEFKDMLLYLKDKNVSDRIEITSNCSLLTKELAETIVDVGIDYLRVSVYATNDVDKADFTRNSISVNKIIDNVKYLREYRERAGKKKPFIYVKTLDTLCNDENLFFDQYEGIADEIKIEETMDWNGTIDAPGSKKMTGKKICPWIFYFMLINPDGSVGSCCVDTEKAINHGNVLTQSVKDVWEGEALFNFQIQQIKDRKKIEFCSKCDTFLNDKFTIDNVDHINLDEFIRRKKERLN